MSETAVSQPNPPRDWLESASLLLRSPRKFFANMPAPVDLAAPRNFIIIMFGAGILESMVYNVDKFIDLGAGLSLLAIALSALLVPIFGFALGAVQGAVLHAVARLLGARQPFAASFAVACYSYVTLPLFIFVAFIPALRPLIIFGNLFLCTLGLIEVYRVRAWKAILLLTLFGALLASARVRAWRHAEQVREAQERDVARRAHPGDI